jgi:predicted aspartyl protease
MKSKFIIFFTALLLGCAIPNANKSQLDDNSLSSEKIFQHINYLQKQLEGQGFGVTVAKPEYNQINMDVKINGHKGKLLLDTGASFGFLGHRTLRRYDLNEYAYKDTENKFIRTHFGGIISDSFPTKADSFEIGNTVFKPWPFIVTKSRDKNGVLGIDFLHFTSSVLICRVGALFLHAEGKPAKNIGSALKTLGYTEIKLLSEQGAGFIKIKRKQNSQLLLDGTLMVPASFEGVKGLSLIDTGAIASNIDATLAKKTNKPIHNFHPYHRFEDARGDTSKVATICLNNFCIGDFCPKEQQCPAVIDHSHENKQNNSGEETTFVGVIGFDTLAKYNAIIDFGNKRLYLQK